jgi:hypothetical protein
LKYEVGSAACAAWKTLSFADGTAQVVEHIGSLNLENVL